MNFLTSIDTQILVGEQETDGAAGCRQQDKKFGLTGDYRCDGRLECAMAACPAPLLSCSCPVGEGRNQKK